MAGNELCIVIPVYNEKNNVPFMFDSLSRALEGMDWEVIFADDDSPDGTADAVREHALKSDRVRLILRVSDRGLSKACIQGMLSAKAEWLCVMDGDGQHPASVVRELLEPLRNGEADIVSAARGLEEAEVAGSLSGKRAALSRFGIWACNRLLRRQLRDPLTGFFVIRRSAFMSVARDLSDSGFKLLLDILATGPWLRHKEVPFAFAPRRHGASKLDSAVAWQVAMFGLSKLTGDVAPARLIGFVLVGASGLAVHFAVLYSVLALGGGFSEAQLCASITAMTSNYFLNNVLTFSDRRLHDGDLVRGYLLFMLVSSIGLAANVSVANIVYREIEGIPGYSALAALAGIMIDTVWKYAVSSRLVWRPKSRRVSENAGPSAAGKS